MLAAATVTSAPVNLEAAAGRAQATGAGAGGLVVDCHGHYTTEPKALFDWRKRQIDAIGDASQRPKVDALVFYGIRSERQLMEQLDYNLLYRWFVGLSPDDPVWDPTTFTKNRERLQSGEVFTKFMTRLLNHSQVKPLLSDEHFSVDGTLIEAWASQKSFRPKEGGGDDHDGANFHGQKRKNDTHASTSDPDSRLYRKAAGREAKLCYMGHATMENRHGLAVTGRVTHANGTAERRLRRRSAMTNCAKALRAPSCGCSANAAPR